MTTRFTRARARLRDDGLATLLREILSDDLVLVVFSCLDARGLWCFMHTCHYFCRIASQDVLWRALLVREVGEGNLPPARSSGSLWRQRYWQWRRLDPCTCTPQIVKSPSPEMTPTARFLHRGTSSTEAPSGRYLYIFGGSNKSSEFNDLWVLDKELSERSSSADASAGQGTTAEPPASAWQRLYADPAPQQRQSATLTAVGTKLLMFGGRQGETTFLNDTWIFDTVLCVWTCVRESDPMQPVVVEGAGPSLRWAHSAACFGDRVLFFGGSAPGRCFNDLHWFDMPTKRWSRQFTTGALPLARSGHCACALGESMFVFGGNTTKASFNDLWEYATRTETWKLVRASGNSPSGRVGHTLTALGCRLLVLGGREYATNHFDSALHSFNLRSRRWSEVALRTPSGEPGTATLRTGHCAAVHAGRLLLFGGLNNHAEMLDDVTSVHLFG